MTRFNSLRVGFGLGAGLALITLAWVLLQSGPDSTLGDSDAAENAHLAEETAEADAERPETPLVRDEQATFKQSGAPTGTNTTAPATMELRLFVVDATSSLPYGELPIELGFRALDSSGALGPRTTRQVKTDSDGRCSITVLAENALCEPFSTEIEGRGGQILPASLVLGPERRQVELKVQLPHGRVAFECIDASGSAVPDARLMLYQAAESGPGRFRSVLTDRQGRAHLPADRLPGVAATWSLQAQHPQHGVAGLLPLTALPDGPPQLIQLVRGSQLMVRVLDQQRNPLAHQRARLRSLAQTKQLHVSQAQAGPMYLDERGECTWTQLLPGPYRLSIPSPVSREWHEFDIEISDALEEREFTATLDPLPVALAGRVLGPSGEAAVHHYLQLHDTQGELIAGTRTNGHGEFKLFGEAQTASVVLSPQTMDNREWNFQSARLEFPAGKHDVVLVGHARTLQQVRVWVRSAQSGDPIADAMISSLGSATDLEEQLARSNQAGLCVLELDPEETLALGASASAHASMAFDWAPGVDFIEVTLPPRVEVQLQVIDAYWGKALAQADLLEADTLRLIGQTTATGMITLPADPNLRFFVRARGYRDSPPLDLQAELSLPSRGFGPRNIALHAEVDASETDGD